MSDEKAEVRTSPPLPFSFRRCRAALDIDQFVPDSVHMLMFLRLLTAITAVVCFVGFSKLKSVQQDLDNKIVGLEGLLIDKKLVYYLSGADSMGKPIRSLVDVDASYENRERKSVGWWVTLLKGRSDEVLQLQYFLLAGGIIAAIATVLPVQRHSMRPVS